MQCNTTQHFIETGDLAYTPVHIRREVELHLAYCQHCQHVKRRKQLVDQQIVQAIHTRPVMGKRETQMQLRSYANSPLAHLRRLSYQIRNLPGLTSLPMTLLGTMVAVVLLFVTQITLPQPLPEIPTTAQRSPEGDALWFVRTRPIPPASLPEDTPLEVSLGYVLRSSNEAAVSVRLMNPRQDNVRYFASPVIVERGGGETVVQFPVNVTYARTLLGKQAMLEAVMRAIEPDSRRVLVRVTSNEMYYLE